MERPKQGEVSSWYLKTIKEARLFDYGPVKGTIVIRPYGYSIWELIQRTLDPEIWRLGCRNAYFPLLIPNSFLEKEAEHVEGFAPECAVVTHGGGKELEEPLVIRPTSETIMYSLFAKWISSWRDLPLKINQWANVVRWEMRPFPFLRTTEFLWHEAHTVHAAMEETEEQISAALDMYRDFFLKTLAIPVIIGKKTEREKFAGAVYSTSCEALLMDGKALQIATAHNLGQNFARPFNISFLTAKPSREFVWQTSWGLSTRAIGGTIMTHGDEKGLILPPRIAPIQVVIIPILGKNPREGIIGSCSRVLGELQKLGVRAEIDLDDETTPGWKFNEWEMRGVPLRIELGQKELEGKSLVLVARDRREKISIPMSEIGRIPGFLQEIQDRLFKRAEEFVKSNTREVLNFDEFLEIIRTVRGFIRAPWCGNSDCEAEVKKKTKATTRCIPFDSEPTTNRCFHCGQEGKFTPIWARAY